MKKKRKKDKKLQGTENIFYFKYSGVKNVNIALLQILLQLMHYFIITLTIFHAQISIVLILFP